MHHLFATILKMDFKNRQGFQHMSESKKGTETKEGARIGRATAEKPKPELPPGKQNRERHNTSDISNFMKQTSVPCLPSHRNYLCVLRLLQTQWNSAPHKHSWASQPSHMDSHSLHPMSQISWCVDVCVLGNSAAGNMLEHAKRRPSLFRCG